MRKNTNIIIALLGLVLGVLFTLTALKVLGLNKKFDGDYNRWRKLNLILHEVQKNYVDTIDMAVMTDAAVTAAGVLENSANVQNAMPQPLVLYHLDAQGLVDDQLYYAQNGENTGSVYFTLNGTPDTEKVAGYTDFTKVGTITVTITPTEITQ